MGKLEDKTGPQREGIRRGKNRKKGERNPDESIRARGKKKKNEWTTAVQQRERSGKGEEKGRPLKEMNDSMLIKLTRSHCG